MRLSVDEGLCIGCGLCEETLPGVAVTGKLATTVIDSKIPVCLFEPARALVHYCPVEALSIEEEAT